MNKSKNMKRVKENEHDASSESAPIDTSRLAMPLERYVTVRGTAARTFEFRVEFESDLDPLMALIGWAVQNYWRSPTEVFGDVDVKLTVKPKTLSIDEMRWLFDRVVDCHTAVETLNLSSRYTSARSYQGASAMGAQRPSAQTIEHAQEGLAEYLDTLDAVRMRAVKARRILQWEVDPLNQQPST